MSSLAVALAAFLLLVAGDEQVLLVVPYRSQLDGTPYQGANCGPTAVAMALAYYGVDATLWDLRVRSMRVQGSWIDSEGGYSDEYGVFVYNLAVVVESFGLRSGGLWRMEGGHRVDGMRRWQADDLRAALRAGRPVLVQTGYRSLPGRARSVYRGDHYVVVHGYRGRTFIYSDPLDREGGGAGLEIEEADLLRAMEQSSAPGAGFAVAPGDRLAVRRAQVAMP